MARCVSLVLLGLLGVIAISGPASAADIAFYFDLGGTELIDLDYPGSQFYGEVGLSLTAPCSLLIEANAFRSPGETDSLGNFISSPLVAGSNFGIDKFGMNSTLIASEADYNNFVAFYDLTLSDGWNMQWGGVAGDLGKFEFWYSGTGSTRQDPLIIELAPIDCATTPEQFKFSSVLDFVELCPQGTYFAMHVGDFTTDPSYWREGAVNPESSYIGVSPVPPYVVPEPAMVTLALLALAPLALRSKRR